MALPSSGTITLGQVQTEFGGSNPIQISEYYGAASGVPASGTIALSDFYGTSAGGPDVGYFSGGLYGTGADYSSYVYKLLFSNSTASLLPGRIYPARNDFMHSCSVGSISNGYWGGGYNDPAGETSYIAKVSYSTDAVTSIIPARLSRSSSGVMSVGDQTYGYFSGGWPSAAQDPGDSIVDRLTYSTDTLSALPSTCRLTPQRSDGASAGNDTYGYVTGGQGGTTDYSSTTRITYSNSTSTLLPGSSGLLSGAGMAFVSNNTVGYFGGRANPANTTAVYKFTHSTATFATNPASLSISRGWCGTTGNADYGYFILGSTPSTAYSRLDRFQYSTDTRTTFGFPIIGGAGGANSSKDNGKA